MTADPRFSSVLFDPEATAAAEQIRSLCGGVPFALVVLGSGLADALNDRWGEPAASQPLGSLPGVSTPVADGHRNELRVYMRECGPVVVATGRTHLYEGHGPLAVTALIRAAACAGIQRAIVTNANGCLRDWDLGDVMVITDHMNLSGSSPFDGPLFVDISQVWDSEMSKRMREHCSREGTYAFLRGPE